MHRSSVVVVVVVVHHGRGRRSLQDRQARPNQSREAGPPGALHTHARAGASEYRAWGSGASEDRAWGGDSFGCWFGGARPSEPPTSSPRKVWTGRERMRPWAGPVDRGLVEFRPSLNSSQQLNAKKIHSIQRLHIPNVGLHVGPHRTANFSQFCAIES